MQSTKQPTDAWRRAYRAALTRDDLEPLRRLLLRSDSEFDANARGVLAELLERRELRRPRGRPATPIYRLSPIETKISRAKHHYRRARKLGWPRAKALTIAAEPRRLRDEVLEDAILSARGRPPSKDGPRTLLEASRIQPWVRAARAFDDDGDIAPLIHILRSQTPSVRLVPLLFADLLGRYKLAGFRDS